MTIAEAILTQMLVQFLPLLAIVVTLVTFAKLIAAGRSARVARLAILVGAAVALAVLVEYVVQYGLQRSGGGAFIALAAAIVLLGVCHHERVELKREQAALF